MDEQLTQQLRDYFATQPVLRAWLFGSYARGEQREDSDVDLLVTFDHEANVGLFAHTRMVMALEKMLGKNVDLVPEGALHSFIAPSVEHDKKLIYSRT